MTNIVSAIHFRKLKITLFRFGSSIDIRLCTSITKDQYSHHHWLYLIICIGLYIFFTIYGVRRTANSTMLSKWLYQVLYSHNFKLIHVFDGTNFPILKPNNWNCITPKKINKYKSTKYNHLLSDYIFRNSAICIDKRTVFYWCETRTLQCLFLDKQVEIHFFFWCLTWTECN